MEKTLEERRAEIRKEADEILRKRKEDREHREVCLLAGICPCCGSALRESHSIFSMLGVDKYTCIICNHNYYW
jgi:hypothetical protein